MAVSDNAIVRIEASANPQGDAAVLASTDNKEYSLPFAPVSELEGFEASIQVSGVVSGLVISGSANVNEIAYSAGIAVIPSAASANPDNGQVTKAAGGTVAGVVRPAAGQVRISSVVLNADLTVTVVDGSDASNFASGRATAGGPPLIPETSVELAQLRLTETSAAIAATEIQQLPGQSRELAIQPLYTLDPFDGKIIFSAALPLIHDVGGNPGAKAIWGKGATPQYIELRGVNFSPAEVAYASTSTQLYGETEAGSTQTLGNAGFTHTMTDGITDPIRSLEGKKVWVDFKQDRNKVPHILTQGTVGVASTFPVDASPQATLTFVASGKSRYYAS